MKKVNKVLVITYWVIFTSMLVSFGLSLLGFVGIFQYFFGSGAAGVFLIVILVFMFIMSAKIKPSKEDIYVLRDSGKSL
jgi:membrane-bound ClpP family serine protease